MSDGPGEQPIEEEPSVDEGLMSTVDAGGAVTPDPFLAAVARIPERADVPFPVPVPRPGDKLGRFTLLSEIGRGGMGVVYAAEDSTLGREVALKVLPTCGDDERRRRFLGEARSAAGLTHGGIATVYDVGEVEGHVFIAMELVHGRTLRAALDKRALPLAEALRIAREIARALAKAHARGVVHRDLKPENVMIAEDGQVKLLDFGLAKKSHAAEAIPGGADPAPGPVPVTVSALAESMMTEAGRVLGTPGYMSPEQAKGRPVDARSDVFSFGVMIYELCTGARPFAGATPAELFAKLDCDEPAPPSRLDPSVPAALERVVLRCLAKDPAARYADAGAVLLDLDGCVAGPPPRRRTLRFLAAAAGVLALAGTALVSFQHPKAHDQVHEHVAHAAAAGPSPREAAVTAYHQGLAELRAGVKCTAAFERALELDPDFGAVHVTLAAMGMFGATEDAREHFRQAERLRGTLQERDRALLDAVEPVVRRQPSDWAESKRRLSAILERSPGDAIVWHLLAGAAANFDSFEEAARHEARAIAADPGFSEAESYQAMTLSYLGRFDEARGVLQQCIGRDPGAAGCLVMLARLADEQGACEDMEAIARQMIAASGEPEWGYALLANALAAQGRPMAMVREAARQAEEGQGPFPLAVERARQKDSVVFLMRMSVFEGDFDLAERSARAYADLVRTSRRQSAHGQAALALASILEETGKPAEAAATAREFLDRRDAWEPDPSAEDMALARDATPNLLLAAIRGGSLTRADAAAHRESWLRGWETRVTPVSRNFLWMYAYAAVAQTPDEAREALAALPAYGSLPPFRPGTLVEAELGRTYLLAGRVEEAIPWLDRAARTCMPLHFPFESMRARFLLAQAREARGDQAGACRDYQSIVARWGQAKPHSVTAEKAAARLATLSCARGAG
jgi:serine/threonine-protein kinase